MPRAILAAWWDEFEARTIHPQAGDAQRREMRNAFYAGAACVMQLNHGIGEPTTSEKQAMAILSGIDAELEEFTRQIKAELEIRTRRRR